MLPGQTETIEDTGTLIDTLTLAQKDYDAAYKILDAARKAVFKRLGKGHFIVENLHINVESDYSITVNDCKVIE